MAYCDSTIAFPLFCEYAVGQPNGRRTRRELVHRRDELLADLTLRAKQASKEKQGSRVSRLKAEVGTLSSELGPHAERLSSKPRVYADANAPAGLVDFMRVQLEWDVLFVLEHDELRRARDREHYRLARQLRRTLVTLDRDYLDDCRFPLSEGSGVIVISAPHERGLARLLRADRPGAVCARDRHRRQSHQWYWSSARRSEVARTR